MKSTTENSKILIYVTKLLYPKYSPFWFFFYMYLMYYKIYKRRFTYTLSPMHDAFLFAYLKLYPNYFSDINNAILVHKDNIYKQDKLLKLFCVNTDSSRNVFVIPSSLCQKDKMFVSQTFYHNLINSGYTSLVQLFNFHENLVKFAEEIDISLIHSPYDINTSLIDSIIGSYFSTPKLIKKNDVIEINIKYFAKELFYLNNKVNNLESVYFKCNKVFFNNFESNDNFFCVTGETTIKQSVNVQSFIPQKNTKVICNWDHADTFGNIRKEVPLCPNGLEIYLERLNKAVGPFFKRRKLNLNPAFLLQGNRGCGKEILVSSLAHRLGMHFYKINNSELTANVYAQNETKIKNAFFNAKMAAPCIISIHNFENFGKNNEGQYDERIMGYFAHELDYLFQNNQFPVILFCCSNGKTIHGDLKKIFLETFEIDAPDITQREQILRWILEEKNIENNINLNEIANKTPGFFFEDLNALVYYAVSSRLSSGKSTLFEENFQKAVDYMQANYNESIGAPKVPKVQWADVGGLGHVKDEIIKTVNLPLRHPEFLKKSGLKRSGILLYGPPGTGKTLIAKAVATECSLCFLSVKGPELLNMYVGQSEQNIRDVFERARRASPCIIFFDELDSLAPNRGMSGDSGGVMDRVVSQLLAEMDGLNESATVFIIGATNRPDLIDPALLRPGRFDKLLYVGPCTDTESKISVLTALTRKFTLKDDLDLAEVVRMCPTNITGADFYGICSNAWLAAVRKLIAKIEAGQLDADIVSQEDVVVNFEDFEIAVSNVKPSIIPEDLRYFEKLKKELSADSIQ